VKNNSKNKIIYIAGLGHSGSTILDMALGCHPMIIGLGEVARLLKANKEHFQSDEFNSLICSCGMRAMTCPFWSVGKEVLTQYDEKDIENKYLGLVSCFSEQYGQDAILVDSSKNPNKYLSFLQDKYDLHVIFLVRDFRSWCYSRHSRTGANMVRLAYKWYKDNRMMERFLKKSKVKYMTLGYEELSFYPEIMLKKICNFSGIDFSDKMLKPIQTSSHIIRGNIARADSTKSQHIQYDARWLTSNKLSLLSPLFAPLLNWNKRNVYSNFMLGKTTAFKVRQQDFILFGDAQKEEALKKLTER